MAIYVRNLRLTNRLKLFRFKTGNSVAILGNSFEINSLSGLPIGNSDAIVANTLQNYSFNHWFAFRYF